MDGTRWEIANEPEVRDAACLKTRRLATDFFESQYKHVTKVTSTFFSIVRGTATSLDMKDRAKSNEREVKIERETEVECHSDCELEWSDTQIPSCWDSRCILPTPSNKTKDNKNEHRSRFSDEVLRRQDTPRECSRQERQTPFDS